MEAEYWKTPRRKHKSTYTKAATTHTHTQGSDQSCNFILCIAENTDHYVCVLFLWASIQGEPKRGFENPLRDTLYNILIHPIRWWWTSRRLFCADKLYTYIRRYLYNIISVFFFFYRPPSSSLVCTLQVLYKLN